MDHTAELMMLSWERRRRRGAIEKPCGLGAKDLKYRAGGVGEQDWVDMGLRKRGVTVASGPVGQRRGMWFNEGKDEFHFHDRECEVLWHLRAPVGCGIQV